MEERIAADLHNHLGRYGIFRSFNDVRDTASRNLGENGILGIVDCDDSRYKNFVEFRGGYRRADIGNAVYVPDKRILIVRGQEVFTKEGHVLVLGVQKGKNIKSKRLEDALKEATDLGGIKIADHPFYRGGIIESIKKNPSLLSYFDSWEVYNAGAELSLFGLLPKNANMKANDFYYIVIRNSGHDVGACSFSDGHSTDIIGRSYTLLPFPNIRNSTALASSLRESLRKTKELVYLINNPSKIDALKHLFNVLFLNRISPIRQLVK